MQLPHFEFAVIAFCDSDLSSFFLLGQFAALAARTHGIELTLEQIGQERDYRTLA